MDEIENHLPKLKAAKKTTYSAIVSQVHLNINPENEPIKNVGGPRSQSFKKIAAFVPNLKPKKSTFIPPALKLNLQNKLPSKEKDDTEIDKQMSEDEIEIIDNSSSSSCSISSSDMENENESNEDFEKKDTENKIENNNKFKLEEIKEFLDDEEQNIEINKNMKNLRRKMSQIKARVVIKNKESEETIHDKFKNNFDIGLKDEKENEVNTLHGSINRSEHKKNNEKPKTKSIFEVLASGKKINK
jgi:hypothetical protein